MKILVVYYSFEGNTRLLANAIAKDTGADILEIKPKTDLTSHGFMKFVWGGKQAFLKETPELEPLTVHPDDYDVLFIGTPVWAFTCSPAIRTFLQANHLRGKQYALFYCHGGNAGKTLTHMKEMLAGNTCIGEFGSVEPLKKGSAEQCRLAGEWAMKTLDLSKDR